MLVFFLMRFETHGTDIEVAKHWSESSTKVRTGLPGVLAAERALLFSRFTLNGDMVFHNYFLRFQIIDGRCEIGHRALFCPCSNDIIYRF